MTGLKGFAMLDVLVALLLLAVTLTGACATLVQTMRATHAALLATRAADLGADLGEDLQGVISAEQAEAVLGAWQGRIAAVLPVAGMEPEEIISLVAMPAEPEDSAGATPADARELILRWRDATGSGTRQLRLPVLAPASGVSP